MTIRTATAEDAESIIRLTRHAGDSPLDEAGAGRYLGQPGTTILLADVDGMPAGMLCFFWRFGLFHAGVVGVLEEIVVDPRYRRRGIGRALLGQALSLLDEQGCCEVSAGVMPDNHASLALLRGGGIDEEALLLEKHGRVTLA